jgi:transcriptional regulator with XRE-family HTH domain
MTIVEITGGMLRAARSLTGLSQQELADRAAISPTAVTA